MAFIEWIEVATCPPEQEPEQGEKVLVWNRIAWWSTPWKPALVSPLAKWPVTHFARVQPPEPPVAEDHSGVDEQDARTLDRLERQRKRRARGRRLRP
ncbi:MAG TPA: hypothetical protein VNK67_12125 [Burkholderiales bacterium]|nr:hypothetical protein [Burkholderiales bacterium]